MANTQIQIKTNGTTTLATAGKYCDRNIDVNVAVPASGTTPSGSKTITTNGTHDVAQYANAVVNVPTGITPTGSKTITENGTYDVTNYASAVVSVTTAKPTQFTNRYDPANVTIDYKVSVSSNVVSKAANSEVNILRIPYTHVANEVVKLRMRGICTVRSNFVVVLYGADGETRVNHFFTSACTITYDEYGDAVITFPSGSVTTSAWYFIELNFQYDGMSSATTALTGPIVTINEPIGNGGYVG